MGHAIKYLYESMSNYIEEDPLSEVIYHKIAINAYETEEDFIEDLHEEEIAYIEVLLEKEIDYARKSGDEKRTEELHDIYELLF